MKTRLGTLAIMAVLAACSAHDDKLDAGNSQAASVSSSTPAARDTLISLSQDKNRTLGSAPDRGELFTYGNKAAVKHRGAYTMLPVQLSEEHAIRGVATGVMSVQAPDGNEIKIRYERHEENADGNWSWIGRVIGGDAAQEAIFTFGEKAVFGSIPQAVGPALRLTTENGIAYLVTADASKLKKAFRAGGDTKTFTSDASDADNALVAVAMAKAEVLAKAEVTSKAFTATNTIDLVIGYTSGFVTSWGTQSAALTRLSNLVAIANQALINSKINARIRVVSSLKVDYTDTTDNGDTLDLLTGNNGTSPVTVPAALAPLRAARDQYGADLVTLVRDFQPQNNGCGIAWLLGADQAPITIAGDAPYAYSVVSDGDYSQSGNTYYCDDITLVHELAHNMGSAHDMANAGGISGRYPYSYGYKTTAALGNFYTVMAYGDNNQTLYRVFSNPDISTCGTRACGVADQADNARSLRQTIPVVSQFRATLVPLIGIPRQDVNGDGKSDLMYRNQTAGSFEHWLMSAQSRSSVVTSTVGSTYSLLATADFNNDGRADLLWGNASRALYVWIANSGGTGYTSASLGNYPEGFVVKGAGDVDGDGNADIVMHNQSTGTVTFWRMNGFKVAGTSSTGISSAYFLAAAGDYDGNGKLDLVWQNSTTRALYSWLGNGTSFPQQYPLGTLSAGVQIIGSGDVNGDGLSDLLFRNTSTGAFSYWLINGGTVVSTWSTPLSLSYSLAAIGDYNGDGRTDLVWANSAGAQYMWLGNGTSFPSQYSINAYSTGFSPVPVGSLW